ncbi:MAG TPA: hypothetical protein VMV75_10865 [Sulfuricella sp.]|nr:hypothetical protein [Sulfuricella sp.]
MKQEEKKLLRLLDALTVEQRDTVIAFVEFLAARNPPVSAAEVQEPLPISRPADETVVKAIKRLRETYPMLNPDKLLHEISGLMMKHMMNGKPAAEVIDELEALFARYYLAYKESLQETPE